jgi:hypothetical protein
MHRGMRRISLLAVFAWSLACGGGSNSGGGSYSSSDLAGTWMMNAIASGPGAPWWERGELTVAANGSFSGTLADDTGASDSQNGTLVITSAGAVTMSISTTGQGAMDAHGSVIAMTSTWTGGSPGTTDLGLVVKEASGATLADLAGTWEMHILASGPGAPWWERDHATIASDGTISGTWEQAGGASGTLSGTLSITSAGVVAMSTAPTFSGILDAGRTVLVGTSSWTDAPPHTAALFVGVKLAGTYALSDLAGTWQSNALATGPGAPWWERAHALVGADGTFSATVTESDLSTRSKTGSWALSPAGILTGGGDAFQGALDAGKTVFVGTGTWDSGSPGTTEMKVAVKLR